MARNAVAGRRGCCRPADGLQAGLERSCTGVCLPDARLSRPRGELLTGEGCTAGLRLRKSSVCLLLGSVIRSARLSQIAGTRQAQEHS